MDVLITGGAGFIGLNLARSHADSGDSVHILDDLSKSEGSPDAEFEALVTRPNIRFTQVDLTRSLDEVETPSVYDIVYHLAAINGTRLFYEIPYQVARANLLMTLRLLDWLEGRSTGRLIYTSTSEVYAAGESLGLLAFPTDETVPVAFPQPTDVRFSYGASKFLGEFLCLQFGRKYDVPTSVVRYHNVYGPRMGDKHVIPELIARLRGGEDPLTIYGAAESRAFCYVADAVEATRRVAVSLACSGEIINIGNARSEVTIQALAELIMKELGRRCQTREGGRRSGSVSRRCPDTTKLRELTGFVAKVDLREGLRRTIAPDEADRRDHVPRTDETAIGSTNLDRWGGIQ
jgi:UDP-glucuronate decarboxylase